MKFVNKKIISAALAGVMCLSLTACGGGGGGEQTPTADGASSNKLTIWAWDQTFNIKSIQMAADLYAQTHEGFEVEIIEKASVDCEANLTTCAQAGDYSAMPDIVLMQDNSYQKFLKSYPDAFTDISDANINWENFPKLKQSYSSMDGKHYGVPFDNGAVIGCYRTDILAEAGYTIDDLKDITWSRFIEIGKDVRQKTGKYLLTSESTGGDTMLMMIQSCGANFVDENGKPYIVENEISNKCVDLYTEMVKNDVVKLVNNWDEYISTITNGEAAGIVNGNWITATLFGVEDQKGKWEITTMPKVDGVDTAVNYANNGGSSWYIPSGAKNPDLAKDFLAATVGSSTDYYDGILPVTGVIASYLPAAETEVYNAPNEFFNDQPIFATIVEYSSHIPEYPRTPYHYESRECINTAIVNMVNGMDREQALKEAEETLAFKMGE